MMHALQDSDPVGAILAAAYPRPAEELITALRKGSHLRKHGRRGKPKIHWFRLSHDDRELLWDSSNGKVRSIPLLSVLRVVQGQTTPVFRREPLPEYEALSFSLLYLEGQHPADAAASGSGGGGSSSRLGSKQRSLDVVCRSQAEFDTWFLGIQLVICLNQAVLAQQQQQQPAPLAAAQSAWQGDGFQPEQPGAALQQVQLQRQQSGPHSLRSSEDRYAEIKQLAASLQPASKTTWALGGSGSAGSSQQRGGGSHPAAAGAAAAAAAGFTAGGGPGASKREIGDCYIWGSWLDAPEVCASEPCDGALQVGSVPVMVTNTHALDITQVAVGARHAALLTRRGEVYTWGAGLGGSSGNGMAAGSNFPQQVMRLAGKGTAAVACGHSYTAAVLHDGSLYSWGTGLGGQLGLGPSVSAAVWPTRILAGLEGIRVSQVSCGPYHAAAISSDGRLFTWGDGLFGKLGHGDHSSAPSPRFVTTLAEHWVVSVSCGWWHTAAAAVARARLTRRTTGTTATSLDGSDTDSSASSSGPGSSAAAVAAAAAAAAAAHAVRRSGSGSDSACFLRGNIVSTASGRQAAGAAMAARAADLGGALFTWGGDFKWQQPWAKDTHQGCLGVGDLAGRLVPTLVKGEDNVVQVACGLNLTVALTANGEVFQMGTTGAVNNREKDKADWKSALVPVLVRGLLSSHVADRLACGMSHVAVVAAQRARAASHGSAGPVVRLLTWGQNSRGQLGIGEGREDHFMPQAVAAVGGRRILYLACGGQYTLAVCEHDPRASRWSRDSGDADALSSAASGTMVASSGPSRLQLPAAAMAGGGSGGGLPYGSERGGLGGAGAAASAAAAAAAGQRAAGGCGSSGLTVSASLSSLASSVPSSRGEGGGAGAGGSGGGSVIMATLARRSERGRVEGRLSDRGFAVYASSTASNHHHHTHQQQYHQQQQQHGSSREPPQLGGSRNRGGLLTLSLDRSLAGLGLTPGRAGATGSELRNVSWALSPPEQRQQRGVAGTHSSRALGAGSSGNGHGMGLQLQDLSLATLAAASKRGHHLPLPRSLKRLGLGRADSANSSGSSLRLSGGWAGTGASNVQQQPPPPPQQQHQGVVCGAREQQPGWALAQGRSSSRQLSYSMRSEPDLASVSVASSMTSAGLSVTPSPSLQSGHEGRAAISVDGGGGRDSSSSASDFQRQLRYWQERAATMEQQLSRKTHEIESMRREMRSSNTSLGTDSAAATLHLSEPAMEHSTSSSASVNLAVRRGLQPLPAVAGPGGNLLAGRASHDLSASAGSSHPLSAVGSRASATPFDVSSGASSAVAGSAAGLPVRHAAAAAMAPRVLGSHPLPDGSLLGGSPGPDEDGDGHSSGEMVDAQEEWPLAAPSAEAGGPADPFVKAAAAAAGGDHALLLRGTSLANWMGSARGAGPAAQPAAAAAAAAATQSTDDSAAGRRNTGSGESASFVFLRGVDAIRQQQQQQAQQQQQQPPGVEIFRGSMGAHSAEASRVLSLFQESHRHRQMLDQEQQQQQAPPPPLSCTSSAASAAAGAQMQKLSPAAQQELDVLRQQNRLLLQQLQQLQQQPLPPHTAAGSSRPLVSVLNPHPFGQTTAATVTRSSLGGLELHTKRRSSASADLTPRASPLFSSSPHSSTLEVDPFRLPPSALLDAAFAEAGAAAAGSSSSSNGPRLQLQSSRRGDAAVPPQPLAAAVPSPRGYASSPVRSGALPQLADVSGWQPVLLRKGSVGAPAPVHDTPVGTATAAAGGDAAGAPVPTHTRSGSSLLRWLSRAGTGNEADIAGGASSTSSAFAERND